MTAPLALPSGARSARRFNVLTLTALLGGAAGFMVVCGLAAAWMSFDEFVRAFPGKEQPDNYTAVMVTITFLFASVFAQWAVTALKKEERGQALAAYGLTFAMVVAGSNALWYLGQRFPFPVDKSAYSVFAYTMFAVVGVELLVAFGVLLFAFFKVVGGQADAPASELPQAAAWLWHFAFASWFVAFFVLYLFRLMFS